MATQSTTKPTAATTAKSNEDKAKDIVNIITNELNRRVGIGAIWRQLGNTRKEEIINKWNFDITEYLKNDKK